MPETETDSEQISHKQASHRRKEKCNRWRILPQKLRKKLKKSRNDIKKSQRRREKIREHTRERVREYREWKQQLDQTLDTKGQDMGSRFQNRTTKKHTTDKVKGEKADVTENLACSPRTRKILSPWKPQKRREKLQVLGALASAISAGLNKTKRSGSNKKRAAFRAFKSLHLEIMSKNLEPKSPWEVWSTSMNKV